MKKIRYKGTGIVVKNTNPTFTYEFNGKPVEVGDKAADIILKNPDFEEVKSKKGE